MFLLCPLQLLINGRFEDAQSGKTFKTYDPRTGEPLMMTIGTATTVGAVTSAREGECEVKLKRPVCAPAGAQIAINRRVGTRWRLIGIGTLTE